MLEVVRQLSLDEQIALLTLCRQVIGQAPLFQKTMPTGAKFRYQCTSAGDYGWISDRQGYRYVTAHPITQRPFPAIPQLIHDIAVDAAAQYGISIKPQSALINWYAADGKLGLHQDKTEASRAPVISLSLGDDCVFIAGGVKRTTPRTEMILKSGDVLIMGEEHRMIYHAVKKIVPSTAPPELDFKQQGRVNITVRQVYEVIQTIQ